MFLETTPERRKGGDKLKINYFSFRKNLLDTPKSTMWGSYRELQTRFLKLLLLDRCLLQIRSRYSLAGGADLNVINNLARAGRLRHAGR